MFHVYSCLEDSEIGQFYDWLGLVFVDFLSHREFLFIETSLAIAVVQHNYTYAYRDMRPFF